MERRIEIIVLKTPQDVTPKLTCYNERHPCVVCGPAVVTNVRWPDGGVDQHVERKVKS